MRYVMLFPGQGAQHMHMCEKILERYSESEKILRQASDVLNVDVLKLMKEGSLLELTTSVNAQPVVLTASYLFAKYYIENTGQVPEIVAGHSLGEISASMCAGWISFEEALLFLKERATIIDRSDKEKTGFSGIVLDISDTTLQSIIEEIRHEGYVTISALNSPRQFMISGERKVERIIDKLIFKQKGQYIPHRMIPMKVNAPVHSELMSPFLNELTELVKRMKFNKNASTQVISMTNCMILRNEEDIKRALINQLVSPVLFSNTINVLCQSNYDLFVDVGPGQVMKNIFLENTKSQNIISLDE